MCSVLQDSRNAKMTAAAPGAGADGVAQTHADRQTNRQTPPPSTPSTNGGEAAVKREVPSCSSQPWKLGPGCKVGMSCIMCYNLSCDAEENDSSCRCSQQQSWSSSAMARGATARPDTQAETCRQAGSRSCWAARF